MQNKELLRDTRESTRFMQMKMMHKWLDSNPLGFAVCNLICKWVFAKHTKDNISGLFCEKDVDECKHYSPCQNYGTCQNTDGGYRCFCMDGFKGNCKERGK